MYYSCIVCRFLEGDWGLGIGDWAQSPIPNPQSPNLIVFIVKLNKDKEKKRDD